MTFEEEFPSLGGYSATIPVESIKSCGNKFWCMCDDTHYFYCDDDIKEHCLDKQKVKDIIENHLIGYQEEATTKWSSEEEQRIAIGKHNVLEDLKKELGLE